MYELFSFRLSFLRLILKFLNPVRKHLMDFRGEYTVSEFPRAHKESIERENVVCEPLILQA